MLFGRANLDVGQLQIPANRVRRADRRVLEARTGVLCLRRNPQPTRRMQIHLEPEAVQQVGVIGTRFEVIIAVPLIPEPFLGLQSIQLGSFSST